MKIAVISDIHANLHALEAVWDDIARHQVDAVYCLGDLVGYGAFPNQVIDFIHKRSVPVVLGNYDDGVGFDREDCGCTYRGEQETELGKQSLIWTRSTTKEKNKAYLRSLPHHIRLEERGLRMLLVHGSPRKINEYVYEDRPQSSFERLAKLADADVLFFGHTHLPYTKQAADTLFINAGSVGKPKDGDPRAGYAILYTNSTPRVEFHRLVYDVKAAADAVRESGLPHHFADLLETGGR